MSKSNWAPEPSVDQPEKQVVRSTVNVMVFAGLDGASVAESSTLLSAGVVAIGVLFALASEYEPPASCVLEPPVP